jgi:uncharacterized protein (TIGR03435 family)
MNASVSKCAGLTALVFASSLMAQSNTEALRFEVASIKPIDPNAAMHRSGLSIYPGGRVVIPTADLKGMIVTAFGVSWWQLSGGEPWMEKEEYDLEAKPPADLQPPITNLRHGLFDIDDERLRQMLQAMLIERFHLKFRRETKTGKVYLLEKKGSTQALRPTDNASIERYMPASPKESSIGFAGGKWNIFNTSMRQLAKFATDNVMHAPIIDRTELPGYFDHRQTTVLDASEINYSDPSGPFMLFLQEMGLKLTADRGPVETFVIESAEKPTPN